MNSYDSTDPQAIREAIDREFNNDTDKIAMLLVMLAHANQVLAVRASQKRAFDERFGDYDLPSCLRRQAS